MDLPPGLSLLPGFLSDDEERSLMGELEALSYEAVVLHGQAARRQVRHFGMSYAYGSGQVRPTEPVPSWLEPLRVRAETAADLRPGRSFEEALLTRYPPGATIGWHRDAPGFGSPVFGVSLGAPCRMRFRHRLRDGPFERADVVLDPRSAYVIAGTARWQWQHSIPPVDELRYSITFRTLRTGAPAA